MKQCIFPTVLHYPKLQRKSLKNISSRQKKGQVLQETQKVIFLQETLVSCQNHSISKCFQVTYVKYTKSSQSKILKSCSIMNIGFNQPKKANNAFQGNLCFPLFLLQLCANIGKVLSDQCTKHFRRCKSCARNPAFRRTFIAMATACSPGSNSETTCDTLMRDGQTLPESALQHKWHCHTHASQHLQKCKGQSRGGCDSSQGSQAPCF